MMLVIKIRPEFYHREASNPEEITSTNITVDAAGSGYSIGFAAYCVRETGVLSGIRHADPMPAPYIQCRTEIANDLIT